MRAYGVATPRPPHPESTNSATSTNGSAWGLSTTKAKPASKRHTDRKRSSRRPSFPVAPIRARSARSDGGSCQQRFPTATWISRAWCDQTERLAFMQRRSCRERPHHRAATSRCGSDRAEPSRLSGTAASSCRMRPSGASTPIGSPPSCTSRRETTISLSRRATRTRRPYFRCVSRTRRATRPDASHDERAPGERRRRAKLVKARQPRSKTTRPRASTA